MPPIGAINTLNVFEKEGDVLCPFRGKHLMCLMQMQMNKWNKTVVILNITFIYFSA